MDSKLKVKAHTCFLGQTGYANHSRNFFSELSKLCDLKIRNSTVDDNKSQYFTEKQKNLIIEQSYFDEEGKFATYPPEGKSEIESFEQDVDIVLETNQHYYFYDNYKPKTSIAYLVWESTRLQEHFFNHLRRNFDYFWCPSTWQRDCMIEQGWPEDKIFVVPEGVDPELKPVNNLKHLLNKEKFQFFLAGRWEYRKSTTEIIKAFLEEFKNDKNVELLCSIDNPFAKDNLTTEQRLTEHNLISDKIKIIHFPKRQDYIRYMQYCHCHISCSRSEGWGLPISDSIACGTPTIYAHNTAPMDFALEIGMPVKTKEMMQAKDCVFLNGVEGEYPEPDFDHLKKQMRYVFNNFKELKEKALAYAPEFLEKYSWKNAAGLAYDILSKVNPNNEPKLRSEKDKNECFIILSHCDTDEKLKELNKCINNLKKYNLPINLYSTTCLNKEAQEIVDSYFYSADNPVFNHENKCLYFNFFKENFDISYKFPDYGYAALTQLKNSLKTCFSLGYDICHVVNYDVIFDDVFFINYRENVFNSKNGLFYCKDDKYANIVTISFKKGETTNAILDSISQSDYLDFKTGFAESYLFNKINGKLDALSFNDFETMSPEHISTSVSSQKMFFYENFSIFYGIECGHNNFLIQLFDVNKLIDYKIKIYLKNEVKFFQGSTSKDETIKTNIDFDDIIDLSITVDETEINLLKLKHIIKFKNKQKEKRETFVILSYCNSESKIQSLNNLIKQLKSCSANISLITPIDIKKQLNFEVDDYMFIDENPLIPIEKRAINSWYIVEDTYRLIESLPDHGYAMLNQVKNALKALRSKYNKFTFLNYDVNFDERLLKDSRKNNGFFYKKNDLKDSASTLLFQVNDAEQFLSKIIDINEDRYMKISEKMVEGLFFDIFKDLNYKNEGCDSHIQSSQSIINFEYLKTLKSKNFDYCFGTTNDNESLKILFFHLKKNVELFFEVNGQLFKKVNLKTHDIIDLDLPKKQINSINIKSDEDFIKISKNDINKKINIELLTHNHLIDINSNALGDTIAWIPYVEEYRKKNNCKITCRCDFKDLFQGEYSEINFVSSVKDLKNASFDKRIDLFYNIDDPFAHKNHPSQITLQQVASDILELEFKEIKPSLYIKNKQKQIKEKYVCIATQSTSQAKYWTTGGWHKTVEYLKSIGYKVICIDKYEEFGIPNYMNKIPKNCINKTGDYDLQDRITDIYNCDFFIGLGSGLSWLAWALNKPVIMISGFSDPIAEFKNKYRVINKNVCNSCWNDPLCKFDRTDWLWCPRNKNFECSKKISFSMVKEKIDQLIFDNGF